MFVCCMNVFMHMAVYAGLRSTLVTKAYPERLRLRERKIQARKSGMCDLG